MCRPCNAYHFFILIYGVRFATSSGSPAATHLPLKGKAKGKTVFLPVDFSAHSVSVRRFSLLSCANSLPLEGKVSVEPTDEVFILIYTAYVPTGNITTIAVEHRTSDARPYGCGILSALSFRKWEYTEHCRRI